jgi:hypothetical protein
MWIEAGAAFVGAAGGELLHWYGIRERLQKKQTSAVLKSGAYWLITFLMIVFSVAGCLIWFADQPTAARTYMLMGAALPTLAKKAIETAHVSASAVKLGPNTPTSFVSIAKQYFSG